MNDAAMLARIRDQVRQVGRGEWTRVHDADGCFVEAEGPDGELLPVVRFHPGADEAEIEFICDAPRNVLFLLGLVDRAIAKARPTRPPAREPAGLPQVDPKNYAAEAGMRCSEPAFLVFLEQVHGLERPLTPERAAQKLRSILGVTSRKNLNTDAQAAERWRQLRGDFAHWKRAGR